MSLYENFTNDTGLSNPVYGSIFNKISQVFNSIRDLRFDSIHYNNGDKQSTISLDSITTSLNVIETIHNIFNSYYTLSKNTTVTLKVTYDGNQYNIIFDGGKTNIPDEVVFIKDYNIFDMFSQVKDFNSYYTEFDRYFKFLENFKSGNKDAVQYLETLFKQRELGDIQLPKKIKAVSNSIDSLKMQQSELLKELEDKQGETAEIEKRKRNAVSSKHNYTHILLEKQKVEDEYNYVNIEYTEIISKLDKVEKLLNTIDIEIKNYVDFNKDGVDIEFLKEKKNIMLKDKESLILSKLDYEGLINTLKAQLNDFNTKYNNAEIGMAENPEELSKILEDLTHDKENIFHKLEALTEEIKVKSNREKTNLFKISENEQIMNTDISFESKEKIVDFLSNVDFTTIVQRYIREYYVFRANQFEKEYDKFTSARKAFMDIAQINFEQLFSIAPYSFEGHNKIIKVEL